MLISYRRRRKLKKQKKYIIIGSFLLLAFFSVGYAAFQATITLNSKGNVIVDSTCENGYVWNITQKDEIQEYIAPCTGTYKLETWGAQGGNSSDLIGGYGGYSVGTITLNRAQKLYVAVGKKGTDAALETSSENYYVTRNGGYNGGGSGTTGKCGSYRYGSAGGGATHIAKTSGLITAFSNSIGDLYIVSGGGGGAFRFNNLATGAYGTGGNAGGQAAPEALFTLGSHTKTHYAQGGTQNAGGLGGSSYADSLYPSGSFGQGGNSYGSNCSNGSGGGGGFYGGGSGGFGPGAGGSSYIGNTSLNNKAMYCFNCDESFDPTHPELLTINTMGESEYVDLTNCPNGYSENPVSKCAKANDGHVRITLVSKR